LSGKVFYLNTIIEKLNVKINAIFDHYDGAISRINKNIQESKEESIVKNAKNLLILI